MSQEPTNIFADVAEEPEVGVKQYHVEADLDDLGIDVFDHEPEEKAIRSTEADLGIDAPLPPDREEIPLHNKTIMDDPVADVKRTITESFNDVFDIGKVEVTADERERFVRCALHDTEMYFDVELEGIGSLVRVAIPTESFTTVAVSAIDVWH